jgi:hypothetical protein
VGSLLKLAEGEMGGGGSWSGIGCHMEGGGGGLAPRVGGWRQAGTGPEPVGPRDMRGGRATPRGWCETGEMGSLTGGPLL